VKHVRVIKIILGLLLIFSGITKIVDPSKTVNLMLEFKVIPEFLILIVVSILPILEILIGVLVLFSGFFLISIYGTLIGLSSDCGCFGSVIKSRIGWGMVVRNGMFVVLIGYNLVKKI